MSLMVHSRLAGCMAVVFAAMLTSGAVAEVPDRNRVCGPGAGDCCPWGMNNTAGCEDVRCCEIVCAIDPSCCEDTWHGMCFLLALEHCNLCPQCGDPDAGDCCAGNGSPNCENEACCSAVCACDPFCCEIEWDQFCATMGFDADCICGPGLCGGANTPECAYCFEDPPPPVCNLNAGDCFFPNGTPGCHDVACCEAVCACDAFCCDVIWDSWCATTGIGSGCGAALLDACNGGCPPLATSCPDCFGYCGTQSPVGCWCDDQCCAFLDCCDEKCDACGMDHGNCDNFGQCVRLPLGCGNSGAGSCCSATDSPYCDDPECCEAVCACDPFCCEVQWDSFCATHGFDADCLCGAGQCGGSNQPECAYCFVSSCETATQDCCASSTTFQPSCNDPSCCDCVCNIFPQCCSMFWGIRCAELALGACAGECTCAQPPTGGEGCSLGFWKQPHHFDHWTNHHPDDSFDSVFSAGVFMGKSLHTVLSQPSGPPTPEEPPQLKNLGKQAVAALLNATSPEVSYNLSPSDVIALVQNAIASGSYNALKDELDALNNQGCPLTQPADLNTDGFINGHDLIILLGNWGKPGLGDINNDGLVDGHDLLELLAAWGT